MRDLGLLPKAHLHLHLEGAMRPATLDELADRAGVEVPALTPTSTFDEFIAVYGIAADLLRTPADIHRLVREVAEDAAADGAVWVEPHVFPGLFGDRFGSWQETLDLLLDAAAEATLATGVGVGLLLAADRILDPALAVELAELGARHADRGVVAFGLSNDERRAPAEPFTRAFAIARDAGLVPAPHAGELLGADSVRQALDHLGPLRIEHGVRAVEDPELVGRLADEGVCLDVCPTSNLRLGVVADIDAHPLPDLLAAGVRCTLNADDPLMFGASLLDEYRLCQRAFALDDAEIAAIARTSLEASGAPMHLKRRGLDGIAAWLA